MKKDKSKKREYDESLADSVIAKFGLDPVTKRVWKSRNSIPGAYFDEDIDTSEKLGDRDPVYQKIRDILGHDAISSTKFRTLLQKGADITRDKDRMTEAELIGMKTEITEIRNDLAKAIKLPTQTNLRAVLRDVRLKPTKIIGNDIYRKIMDTGRAPITDAEKDTVKSKFNKLYNQLKL